MHEWQPCCADPGLPTSEDNKLGRRIDLLQVCATEGAFFRVVVPIRDDRKLKLPLA